MDDRAIPTPGEIFDLSGKVCLVTGGSRGLGREMVRGFAAAGADVAITSRKIDDCREAAAEVQELTGREAFAHACHVGRWDEIPDLVDAVYERFGRIDVLVNNAGVSPRYDDLASITEKLVDVTFSVNFKGPLRLATLIGPRMAEQGGGSIINVSTAASLRPDADYIVYGAAKSALNTLTEGLAQAYGPTVRVNTLVPGPYLTDMAEAWDEEELETFFARFALKRGAQPAEIVGAALFLASEASSFTTGSMIRADGGPY